MAFRTPARHRQHRRGISAQVTTGIFFSYQLNAVEVLRYIGKVHSTERARHVRHCWAVFEGQVAGAAARRDAFGDADLAQRPRPRQRRHRHLRRADRQDAGQDHHPVGRARARFPRASRHELGEGDRRTGRASPSSRPMPSSTTTTDKARRQRARRSRRCAPRSASWAPARSSRSTRKSACPSAVVERFDLRKHGRHAWHRPHAHGDRVAP